MHDRNRGDHTQTGLIAGIVVAVLIAAAFIGWGLWKAAEYEREASDHAREYAAYADKQIRQSCLRLASVEQQDCTAKARHAQRDNERNERDLVAQRQSALWALIMGAAAVIGMGLSVIGVFLVWTTFAETRRANAIAHDALDGQLRPWLTLGVNFYGLKCVDGVLIANPHIEIENKGPSPALYIDYVAILTSKPARAEQVFNWLPELFKPNAKRNHYRILFPGHVWEKDLEARNFNLLQGVQYVGLLVAVRYRTPYSPKYRYTCKVFDVVNNRRADKMFDIVADHQFTAIDIEICDELAT